MFKCPPTSLRKIRLDEAVQAVVTLDIKGYRSFGEGLLRRHRDGFSEQVRREHQSEHKENFLPQDGRCETGRNPTFPLRWTTVYPSLRLSFQAGGQKNSWPILAVPVWVVATCGHPFLTASQRLNKLVALGNGLTEVASGNVRHRKARLVDSLPLATFWHRNLIVDESRPASWALVIG